MKFKESTANSDPVCVSFLKGLSKAPCNTGRNKFKSVNTAILIRKRSTVTTHGSKPHKLRKKAFPVNSRNT